MDIFYWCFSDMEEQEDSDATLIEAVNAKDAARRATYDAIKEIGEQHEYYFSLAITDTNDNVSYWDVRVLMRPIIEIREGIYEEEPSWWNDEN